MAATGRKPKMNKEQHRRFVETARAIGADETGEAFERAFGKIVPPKRAPEAVPKGTDPSRPKSHRR